MGNFSSTRENLKRPPSDILEAADFIARGGIGAVPTETVYGLAADAANPDAVRKIFEAKGRPFIDPLIVHVCDIGMAREVAEFTPEAERLAREFWPGPLTMVLKKKPVIPAITTAGMDTVAVRMPSHPDMLGLIRASSRPIAAPSANPFGYVSPTCAEHVRSALGGKIDFVIDGGECACGVESTIVMMASSPKKLLRPGPIPPEEIARALGESLDVSPKVNEARPQAPGMLKSHYSPHSKLSLFSDPSEIPAGFPGNVIYLSRPAEPKGNEYWLSESGDLAEAAKNLFALIRRLDAGGKDILCQRPPLAGIGLAIADRLGRAETKP